MVSGMGRLVGVGDAEVSAFNTGGTEDTG